MNCGEYTPIHGTAEYGRMQEGGCAGWCGRPVGSAGLDNHEGIKVARVHGDRLPGIHALGDLRLKCVFGNVTVRWDTGCSSVSGLRLG